MAPRKVVSDGEFEGISSADEEYKPAGKGAEKRAKKAGKGSSSAPPKKRAPKSGSASALGESSARAGDLSNGVLDLEDSLPY